jgi:hypothetical protein
MAIEDIAAEAQFTRIADEPGNTGWDGYDWSKPSLAVVAMGERGGCVLWTVGAHVEFGMIEGCGYPWLGDLGIEPDDEGIFVWEGKTKSWFPDIDAFRAEAGLPTGYDHGDNE